MRELTRNECRRIVGGSAGSVGFDPKPRMPDSLSPFDNSLERFKCYKYDPKTGLPSGIKPNYQGKVKSGNGVPPQNFSPKEAGRNGAFREAKRASGIAETEQPIKVEQARDRNGKLLTDGGRDYYFRDGKVIKEHYGHKFPDDPTQNRGTHFNDIHGNHYDY